MPGRYTDMQRRQSFGNLVNARQNVLVPSVAVPNEHDPVASSLGSISLAEVPLEGFKENGVRFVQTIR